MANKIWGSNNEPLKIQFITDTHYYCLLYTSDAADE